MDGTHTYLDVASIAKVHRSLVYRIARDTCHAPRYSRLMYRLESLERAVLQLQARIDALVSNVDRTRPSRALY